MGDDLLADAVWECCSTFPGLADDPTALGILPATWWPATVPGTAAAAMRAAGIPDAGSRDYDATDWWFRCRFAGPAEPVPMLLRLGGLATVADVWLNGRHLLHSDNMFLSHEVEIEAVEPDNELLIRCTALTTVLARRRPRPRWKTYLIAHQNLRWVRTTLLGRLPGWAVIPAPVGPWRPVQLLPTPPLRVGRRRVVATCDGDDGVVEVELRLPTSMAPSEAQLQVEGHRAPLEVWSEDGDIVARGSVRIPGVQRWWPHTHGRQPLYRVTVEVAGRTLELGRVGFRTVEVDRTDGAFTVVVNGVPVFCRGAVWMPVDPVSMAPSGDDVRSTLELARAAHLNMVRLPGTGVYQDERFWDLCDELGMLVWQDCMLAFSDPPDAPEHVAALEQELTGVFQGLGGRPALAVVCGGQEIESQAAMVSVPRERWVCPVLESTIPEVVARWLPGLPYVTSNPTGGTMPHQMDCGVSHYFGVGGYLQPVDDARRANVRFATECLAFATPPERQTVDQACGGASRAGHDPGWKLAIHHDAGRSWDLEDMQGFYVRQLFGADPFEERYRDAERALDLGRATVATLVYMVLSEWRRAGSTSSGGLVLALRDLRPGAGWGLIDALGRPKAPWFTLRRVCRPVALLVTDEGLNGLHVHLVNDTADDVHGIVRVELFVRGELRGEVAERAVVVPARGGLSLEVADLFDEFRDLTGAYGFGPPAHDVVVASLVGPDGEPMSEVVHLPGGLDRPLEGEIGLQARVITGAEGWWQVEVTTRRFAQWVVVDVPGYRPDDSWFHLKPGGRRLVGLQRAGADGPPAGEVRAFNSGLTARVRADGHRGG